MLISLLLLVGAPAPTPLPTRAPVVAETLGPERRAPSPPRRRVLLRGGVRVVAQPPPAPAAERPNGPALP